MGEVMHIGWSEGRLGLANIGDEEWCARAEARFAGVELPVDDLTVQFFVEDSPSVGPDGGVNGVYGGPSLAAHWFQVSGGRLARWRSGEGPADLAIRQGWVAHLAMLAGTPEQAEGLLDSEVGDRRDGSWRFLPIPPLDLWDISVKLPSIPGTSFISQHHLRGGPFGDLALWWRLDEGIPVERSLGIHTEADVTSSGSYENYLAHQHGLITSVEMLQDGRIEGRWPLLMTLAGIVESPEFRDLVEPHLRATDLDLMELSRLLRSGTWRSTMAAVAPDVAIPSGGSAPTRVWPVPTPGPAGGRDTPSRLPARPDQDIRELFETLWGTHGDAGGGQLWVSMGGEVVADVAIGVDGRGRPVTPDTLFAVYFATQPVLAVAVAQLWEAGTLGLDDPVSEHLDRPMSERLAAVTPRQLLAHTAGLHRLSALEYVLCPRARRDDLVFGLEPDPAWRPGDDAGYSEVAAWHVLGRLVEQATGVDLPGYLSRRVLDGAEGCYVGIPEGSYRNVAERIGVNISDAYGVRAPMLLERSRHWCCDWNPAFGGYASASGLGRFYDQLLAARHGEPAALLRPETVEHLTTADHPPTWTEVVQRTCTFGLGFMVGLGDHFFGTRVGPRAFGHAGTGGMTAAFADPDRDLVVAIHLNALSDGEAAVTLRRPATLNRLLDHLGIDVTA